jgi:hypothetical protein
LTTSTWQQTNKRDTALRQDSGTAILTDVQAAVDRFVSWFDGYGETSYDHQSFFASRLGRSAKALYYKRPMLGIAAVSPMILCEAFLPSARALFYIKQRFPIADAHYAMAFAFLAQITGNEGYYGRAVHFLDVLESTRSQSFERYGWGYPFDWETRNGTMKQGTPMITSVPYMYEAFREVFLIDSDTKWQRIMASIGAHAAYDYHDRQTSERASSCSYTPDPADPCGVINASAYRAFVLTRASLDFADSDYGAIAERNLRFVIESQNEDGSWHYSIDGQRDFIDHFHTCFVIKALAKIEALTGDAECTRAIQRGIGYYVQNLFDADGFPKPFSRRPRMTIYRNELYDYAECINLAVLLRGRFAALDSILKKLLELGPWQKGDGSFRARRLLIGWDNVPMHRWAQAQMFRSLCFFLREEKQRNVNAIAG